MFTDFSSSIMLISLIAGALACFATFGFVASLYKANPDKYIKLLSVYTLLVGLGLFSIHFMNMRAFNHTYMNELSYFYLLIALGFSCSVAYAVLHTANKLTLPIYSLIISGLQAGFSGYGIFIFFTKAMLAGQFEILLLPSILAISIAVGVGILSIITFYWLKSYDGAHRYSVRAFFSILISTGILSTHLAFNTCLSAVSAYESDGSILNSSFVTMLFAMVLIFVFLTAFIVVVFYDRLNPNIVKRINFKNTTSVTNPLDSFDPLTKLPNRNALNQHLQLAAKRCDRLGDSMALAYIDLDHFKPVNDSFGHHVGDLLLIEVAERFNSAIRNCDYIARAGGDEFVAILGEIDAHESIVAVVQRVIDAVKEPFFIEGHLIEISCSVGVAIYPRDGNLEKLKVSADAAMYKAKENGRNQFRFYDAEIEQASDEMQKIRKELLDALEKHEFTLYFQPKIISKTQAPAGAEALLRWRHPSKGLLTPIYFIEAAERFGFIDKINNWVLIEACKTIHDADKNGIQLNLSVNLSRQQFRNAQLVDHIKSIMEEYHVAPQSLIFEISETHAIHNQSQFKKLLSKFKSAHLKVSIDDFGLHPFSLTYLQNLEVSEVKLDKSFTSGVAKYGSALAIVDAVVKLAHALNLTVVAEGVESDDQREALITTGCDQLQGYFFSKPVPAEQLFAIYYKLHANFNDTGEFSISDYLDLTPSSEEV
ncbi:MAG: EAL domain-containing protein [Methylophilus sp.]|nr:EAL domain-containing protein [Methylophilus sp.]MDP3608529.1 EAL domain-containing protein [Methylophilus sp.]